MNSWIWRKSLDKKYILTLQSEYFIYLKKRIMLDIKSQTRKEIWHAKKLIYESDDNTKRSFMLSMASLVTHLFFI